MSKNKTGFDQKELAALIERLVREKERHQQEKIARKIGEMKHEQTAECVAELLYSDDAYVRNIAIEILIYLGEKALPVLERKLYDKNRNIRKFSLDALRNIRTIQSCEMALKALDDPDENVVEAAIEVIMEQQYADASGRLVEMLKRTDSVWVLDALIRAFGRLGAKGIADEIEEKILSLNATTIEKNILINTLVKSLGTIGSSQDIEKILNTYSVQYMVNDSNLIFGLSGLIVNNNVSILPNEVILKIENIFKKYRDYSDAELTLLLIAASVKLKLVFFLDDVKEIVSLHKREEFFIENLLDLICNLNNIPHDFVSKMLYSEERELILIGLNLIYKKHICGFNSIVEELCYSEDNEISKLAINIISDLDCYKNICLLENFTDFNEEAAKIAVEGVNVLDANTIDFLFSKLEHKSQKVRKAASAKLISLASEICIERLEGIVKRNHGEEGLEALEVMFRFDRNLAWKYIAARMDSWDDKVRAGLVDIIEDSDDSTFYNFMETMVNDPSYMVRKKAIKALCKRIEDRSLQLLEKLLQYESNVANRKDIISNLYKFNNDKALKIAMDAAGSSNPLIRIAAVKSLELFNDERANSVLREMLKDQVEEVRKLAERALHRGEMIE
ncbi:MAG: HEAT repeat domain-containing protein [Firmicutes bacterium]|nr:HEAT repeat domain-containing protein [Bacillota bacterium]